MLNSRPEDGGLLDTRLRALSHPGRREMIRRALDVERSASELAQLASLSRPAASQHLSTLVQAGLMTVREQGRHRWYRTEHTALLATQQRLAGFWGKRLARLKDAVES